ncbi:Uncharacterised protein [Zhongshania aliphaticivorans]|uniref:ATP-NAD kinase n=1 Tax=Zhongshania aliphaticivorans TaxID=1470434 RepID=A0A5S9NZZ4_9GAMM|nr:ATP-NAD kinase family protein [Zhongshania aliphaticivorans]CAA0089496.1 Uncharacterised protein [Zhongshania aliphaticivorans]CAA0096315.1 Uncharacterised protein [Zhongshania aliphaticivorans]
MATTLGDAMFTLGLIVNPFAGLGGPLGMKGSDNLDPAGIKDQDIGRSSARAMRCLERIADKANDKITVFGFAGLMAGQWQGGDNAMLAGLPFCSVGSVDNPYQSTALDTQRAAITLVNKGVDLLLFVGGDGTARDILSAVGTKVPCLGVPAGVKMHSGVYAVSPESAADIVVALIAGGLVALCEQEVRDIDEVAFRAGQVRSAHFGEMLVPSIGGFLQHVKAGGREQEELVLADIADDVVESMSMDTQYLIGPGSTTAAVMLRLGLENTLLGFDAILNNTLIGRDLNALALEKLLDNHQGPVMVIITAIGGQGHILGRGNQQLTPAIIQKIGRENFTVIATKTKISELQGRPLLVDSNDAELDRAWEGYIPVLTGYRDVVMYKVSASGE